MEPGVVGIFRPILVLPEGMIDRLGDSELEAIIAHEIAHVRRRDNLVSSIHMLIEALFWFHPMIWWLGAKIVQERERACDEAVLQLGRDPQSYAEGILKVCEFYLESPLECVSGITGSDMKKRIQTIMAHHVGSKLSLAGKLALATACFAALAIPIVIGLLNAPLTQAQPQLGQMPSFEVASIKPADRCEGHFPDIQGIPGGPPPNVKFQPGGRFSGCTTLKVFMETAYQTEKLRIANGPDWINAALYQIEAKAAGEAEKEQMCLMLQKLLEERFNLRIHRETREMNVYSLIEAKGGNKLQQAKDEKGNPIVTLPSSDAMREHWANGERKDIPERSRPGVNLVLSNGSEVEFVANTVSMGALADKLLGAVHRKVIDKTGLTGLYDISIRYALDDYSKSFVVLPQDPSGKTDPALTKEPSSGSIFAVLQAQLGLKLEPDKVQAEYIVIDSVEKSSEN